MVPLAYLESSSRRKEFPMATAPESSVICCRIWATTSLFTECVPYLSSQYMVLMRYNCCMLRAGHRLPVISLSSFLGFWGTTCTHKRAAQSARMDTNPRDRGQVQDPKPAQPEQQRQARGAEARLVLADDKGCAWASDPAASGTQLSTA